MHNVASMIVMTSFWALLKGNSKRTILTTERIETAKMKISKLVGHPISEPALFPVPSTRKSVATSGGISGELLIGPQHQAFATSGASSITSSVVLLTVAR